MHEQRGVDPLNICQGGGGEGRLTGHDVCSMCHPGKVSTSSRRPPSQPSIWKLRPTPGPSATKCCRLDLARPARAVVGYGCRQCAPGSKLRLVGHEQACS